MKYLGIVFLLLLLAALPVPAPAAEHEALSGRITNFFSRTHVKVFRVVHRQLFSEYLYKGNQGHQFSRLVTHNYTYISFTNGDNRFIPEFYNITNGTKGYLQIVDGAEILCLTGRSPCLPVAGLLK